MVVGISGVRYGRDSRALYPEQRCLCFDPALAGRESRQK
jgi:hypothetical protein